MIRAAIDGVGLAFMSDEHAAPHIGVFSRLTCPSTGPLLDRVMTAASTAKTSRRNRSTKFCSDRIPVACARPIHRCRAAVVRAFFLLGGVGCRKRERKPN